MPWEILGSARDLLMYQLLTEMQQHGSATASHASMHHNCCCHWQQQLAAAARQLTLHSCSLLCPAGPRLIAITTSRWHGCSGYKQQLSHLTRTWRDMR